MKRTWLFSTFIGVVFTFGTAFAAQPAQFDLRSAFGQSYVSSVKSQQGGTCWAHGTMAAIESNLLMTGAWHEGREQGEPNLAEYHLDWWNGFNKNDNPDIFPASAGLTVHEGGDYRVAAAYLTRSVGSVRDEDAQSYATAPKQKNPLYHYFYVRDIEWYSTGDNLQSIDDIKQALTDGGAIGTALAWSSSFYSASRFSFYQPATSTVEPNHAVTIVGWDDNKVTQAPLPGAWLIKNSWGSTWGDRGYFWISYHDKVAGKHGEMGAVGFRNVTTMNFDHVYAHDTHGWRDTKSEASEAFNVFTVQGNQGAGENLAAVNFVTAADQASYTVKVWGDFVNGELTNELSTQSGAIAHKGHHTVDLPAPVHLQSGQKFYVSVSLDKGGQAFDRTSEVPVLLGSKSKVLVESRGEAGESFYRKDGAWRDLHQDDVSANFCIKALTRF